jgi:hypothetical protein
VSISGIPQRLGGIFAFLENFGKPFAKKRDAKKGSKGNHLSRITDIPEIPQRLGGILDFWEILANRLPKNVMPKRAPRVITYPE